MVRRARVLVIGAGVSGLTAAIRLREAGFDARVVARERPHETVSRVAAAVWLPYRAEPPERVLAWAARSLAVMRELARDPESGVVLRAGVQVGAALGDEPWHAIPGTGLRAARPEELPPGHPSGLAFEVPVCEMPVHLDWLVRRFEALGGTIEREQVGSLDEALERAPVVVNASGLGARELVPDASMFAIRGQVASVAREGDARVLLDERDPDRIAYVIPRSRDVILGGVAVEGDESLAPDAEQTRGIVARCATLDPALAARELLEVRVGLRPGRPAVRLEAERRAGGLVIHDYGHGGAGVTLSWGCAEELVRLASEGTA
jgi:D-amino-acid oxidase